MYFLGSQASKGHLAQPQYDVLCGVSGLKRYVSIYLLCWINLYDFKIKWICSWTDSPMVSLESFGVILQLVSWMLRTFNWSYMQFCPFNFVLTCCAHLGCAWPFRTYILGPCESYRDRKIRLSKRAHSKLVHVPRVLNNVDKTPKIDVMSLVTPLFCWGFVYLVIWPWETATHDSCTLVLSAIFEQNLWCPSHVLKLGVVNFCLSFSQAVVSRRQSSTAWAVTTSTATQNSVKSPWGEGLGFLDKGLNIETGQWIKLKEMAASQTKQKAPYCVHTIWLMGSFHGRIWEWIGPVALKSGIIRNPDEDGRILQPDWRAS